MRLTLNGRPREVPVEPGERLLALLHRLHLTGAKFGCGQGECGACTVLVNGRLSYSCLALAEACDGLDVVTVEGLGGTADHELAPLQRAFVAYDAAQCGYCTPGQLIAATHLLERHPTPTDDQIREGMSGNLCRCGTYPKIAAAIRAVSRGDFAGGVPGPGANVAPPAARGTETNRGA
ncbi:MAG TPA: (2Fe-2S)-binding protein [Gemmatimonadaceae bacterium]|nr:(2Fe-2S)-binding protein [Gemmatimonadaceae bacterium]